MHNIHKTAIIGTGYWGSIIAKTFTKITKKKIIVFDKNKQNSNLLKKKFKQILIAKNINEILHNKSIENVILATHPSINFKLGKEVLKKKKNLFVEKPIVKNQDKLLKLIRLAEKKKQNFNGRIYIFV